MKERGETERGVGERGLYLAWMSSMGKRMLASVHKASNSCVAGTQRRWEGRRR